MIGGWKAGKGSTMTVEKRNYRRQPELGKVSFDSVKAL
jgi:hypothetical protein